MANYNNIAWAYDVLAKIVFSNKLALAKQAFLAQIPPRAKILIVGGGTGEIIDYLPKSAKQGPIDYCEASLQMIHRAEKRNNFRLDINFYQQPILEFRGEGYDYILTNFFFDQFSLLEAQQILTHIKGKLKPNGEVIFSDFVTTNNYWDKLLMRIMYLFFKITTNISANTLLSHELLFSSAGFYARVTKKISRNIVAITYAVQPPAMT